MSDVKVTHLRLERWMVLTRWGLEARLAGVWGTVGKVAAAEVPGLEAGALVSGLMCSCLCLIVLFLIAGTRFRRKGNKGE